LIFNLDLFYSIIECYLLLILVNRLVNLNFLYIKYLNHIFMQANALYMARSVLYTLPLILAQR